jgi:hypothetical protein
MYNTKRIFILWTTLVAVAAILVLKYVINQAGWEFLAITSLHTGMLAGTIFVLGFILSSTHADYKESEKIPVEIANAIESLHQDAILLNAKETSFPLQKFKSSLYTILVTFKQDIQNHTHESVKKAKALGAYFPIMENLNVPANYIVKLKQDQAAIIRSLLRVSYLLRISPLPSAFILVEAISLVMVLMLLFTQVGRLVDEFFITGFFSFIYIYLLRLIRVMDRPFHTEGTTQDDVSLFIIEGQIQKLSE